MIKVEAVQIGDSLPAPLLTLIVGPGEERRGVAETKKDLADRDGLRYRFWAQLLDRAREKTNLHSSISPGRFNWIGKVERGLSWNYVVRQHGAGVEFYISRESGEENYEIFDELHASRHAVEEAYGGPLEWQRLEGKRACRVRQQFDSGGYQDEAKWPAVQDELISAMVRMSEALKPHVDQLRL